MFKEVLEKFGYTLEKKQEEKKPSESQLVSIFSDLKKHSELFNLVIENVFVNCKDECESMEDLRFRLKNITEPAEALHFAKLIDSTLGEGTFRKLSFIGTGVDAEKNVRKILEKDLKNKSFEGMVEKGAYLNLKEDYGVEWGLEKTSRDIWQNFFDGNGQTLDGINMSVIEEEIGGEKRVKIKLSGDQEYDWRELVHLGGTTKKDSKTDAGGFGEGTKVLSLILLRDYGAQNIKFSSNGWELEFYIDRLPTGSYRNKEDRGLFAKKRKNNSTPGNNLQLIFVGEDAKKKAETIKVGRELFYSSDNLDFQNPTFDNKTVGGFKMLAPKDGVFGPITQKGHLYIAGQRMHFDSRDDWNTVEHINIWTWQKFLPKDRDRGLITRNEVDEIIPPIVEAMSLEEATKCVYEFKPLWERLSVYEVGYKLLKEVVEKLSKNGVKLQFEKDYLADDIPWSQNWISQALKQEGYKMCVNFLSKIGMTKSSDRFKELQSHSKVEETPQERAKIDLLRKISTAVGFNESDLKDVWIFSGEEEKSIFHGQYNDMFFWMAQEALQGELLDALDTYVHEAAHKAGPHGNPQFEYTHGHFQKEVRRFILEHGDEFKTFEKEWEQID